MKPSRRRTLQVKTTQCQNCKFADKRALRKGWEHCKFKNPNIANGHCEEFQPINPKKSNGNTTRDKKRENKDDAIKR